METNLLELIIVLCVCCLLVAAFIGGAFIVCVTHNGTLAGFGGECINYKEVSCYYEKGSRGCKFDDQICLTNNFTWDWGKNA